MTKNATSTDSGNSDLPSVGFRQTLSKKERLCQKRAFNHLFKGGSSFYKGRLWVIYCTDLPAELQLHPLMVTFAVPRRSFKRANKRNLLKRRLKEAYRLNRNPLLEALISQNTQLTFLVKYNSKEICTYKEIEKDLKRVFNKLEQLFLKGKDGNPD